MMSVPSWSNGTDQSAGRNRTWTVICGCPAAQGPIQPAIDDKAVMVPAEASGERQRHPKSAGCSRQRHASAGELHGLTERIPYDVRPRATNAKRYLVVLSEC